MMIYRWYSNLNDITVLLTDAELKASAISHYESLCRDIAIPDDPTIGGLYIIDDRLCRRVGAAIIDEWGSTLDLYIDIQTGEIVDTFEINVG